MIRPGHKEAFHRSHDGAFRDSGRPAERAARFYRELFGWEISKWDAPTEGMADRDPGLSTGWCARSPTTTRAGPRAPGSTAG